MKSKFECHFCMKTFDDRITPRIEFQKGFKDYKSCGSCWDKHRGEYLVKENLQDYKPQSGTEIAMILREQERLYIVEGMSKKILSALIPWLTIEYKCLCGNKAILGASQSDEDLMAMIEDLDKLINRNLEIYNDHQQ